MPSSLTSPAPSQPEGQPTLLALLASVPDPRDPRGVRHPLPVLLAVAITAVLAGARLFTASAPNRKWCGDVTYIKTWDGWAYLATVIAPAWSPTPSKWPCQPHTLTGSDLSFGPRHRLGWVPRPRRDALQVPLWHS